MVARTVPGMSTTTSLQPDPVMTAVAEGIALREHGDRAGALALLDALWQQVGSDGDPLHRCALAHSLADVQGDPRDELAWDLLALAAADQITPERAEAGGIGSSVAGFYASLHLNLADVYSRLGDSASTSEHLAAGYRSLSALDGTGYGQMIREALDRIAARTLTSADDVSPQG